MAKSSPRNHSLFYFFPDSFKNPASSSAFPTYLQLYISPYLT